MIGERVRHVRTYYGWSQEELAGMAGVTQSAISQLEHSGAVSAETLKAISHATHFPIDYFHRGPLPDMPTGSLRFRKRATSTKKSDERVRAHVRQATELVRTYESRVQLPKVCIGAVPMSANLTPDDIEVKAHEAREALRISSTSPIPHLVRAMERAGIVVIGSVNEIQKHDAASYWPSYPEGRPIICCSKGLPGDRQRFSNAHELGHLILHTLRQVGTEKAEAEAHRFAGALLLPAAVAREVIPQPVTLRGLAHIKAQFGISIRALIRRSLDLELIDGARRLSLEKQMASRGWSKQEPVFVAEEEPLLIRRYVEAVTGELTVSKIANAVGYAPLITRELVA